MSKKYEKGGNALQDKTRQDDDDTTTTTNTILRGHEQALARSWPKNVRLNFEYYFSVETNFEFVIIGENLRGSLQNAHRLEKINQKKKELVS